MAEDEKDAEATIKEKGPLGAVLCPSNCLHVFPHCDSLKGQDAAKAQFNPLDVASLAEACRDNNFGGFCVWDGVAYFRKQTPAELRRGLEASQGCVFYVLNDMIKDEEVL